jgi:aldehyde:ferredoxin oxidoreductase
MKIKCGWQGKILRINLITGKTQTLPTEQLAERFIGGRGFVTKLYWDEVDPKSDALHPDNPLIMMTGPLAGTPAIAGSRWIIGGKSPLLYPDQFGLGSLGGSFGVQIKAAGYDGIIIIGKAPKPSYIHITDTKAEIKDAKGLWGCQTQDALKRLRCEHGENSQAVCIGPAGENLVRFAIAVSDNGACGGSGFGAVMGSKNLKAVVMEGSGKTGVAQPDELRQVNRRIRSLIKGRIIIDPPVGGIELVKRTPCPGCPAGCARGLFKSISGQEEVRKNCQSLYMYYAWDKKQHAGEATENTFHATSLCNRFGLCTQETGNMLNWLNACMEHGILTDGESEISFSRMGTLEFIETFVNKIITRKGFGDILAEGTVRAARAFGKGAEELAELFVTKNGFNVHAYNPRYFITNAVFYATESTSTMNQLHELCLPFMKWVLWYASDGSMSPFSTRIMQNIARKFWKSEKAVDFSTYEGKAEVAYIIQNREYAKENLVACDFFYPITTAEGAENCTGDPTVESCLLSAVTGMDFNEESYYRTGERVFNLQRAIQGREGRAGRKDDRLNEINFTEGLEKEGGFFGLFNPEFMLPGPGGELISRKGAVVERDKFEKMMDEYYCIRGWDVKTGLQKKEMLDALCLSEIVPVLEAEGLVV